MSNGKPSQICNILYLITSGAMKKAPTAEATLTRSTLRRKLPKSAYYKAWHILIEFLPPQEGSQSRSKKKSPIAGPTISKDNAAALRNIVNTCVWVKNQSPTEGYSQIFSNILKVFVCLSN